MICAGMELYGFCGGHFGRDHYGDKRVEGFGTDWIVAREDDGGPNFASFKDMEARDKFVEEFSSKSSHPDFCHECEDIHDEGDPCVP